MTDLAKLVVKLEAEIGKYVSSLDAAQKRLDKFESSVGDSVKKIGTSFLAVGTAAATGLLALTKNAIDTADHLNDLSKSSGVSVETIQTLGYAFKQGGVDSDSFATILKKLNVNIADAAGNAKGEAAAAFKALGISVRDANGAVKAGDTILGELAGKFEGFADGPNKVAIAVKLMGKAGEAAIPTLDDGAESLRKLSDQARATGAVISGDLAQAADDFNDKLEQLHQSSLGALSKDIIEKLLPGLTNLADVLQNTSGRAETFDAIAGVLAITLKGLVTAGIIVTSVFQQVGRIIYGVNVAILDLVSGHLSLAAEELKDTFKDVGTNVKDDFNKIRALFSDGSNGLLEDVKVSVKKIKEQAPNIAGTKAADDAATQALKKLKDFSDKLKEQVSTFNSGEAAATKYRLTIGDLADDVAAAGVAGKGLAASIIAQAQALETLKNVDALSDITKSLNEQIVTFEKGDQAVLDYKLSVGDLAEKVQKAGAAGGVLANGIKIQTQQLQALKNVNALDGINNQINELTGHTKEAALAAFDLQNKMQKIAFNEEGNAAGLKALDTLRNLTAAQAEYNELQTQAAKIQDNLSRVEEEVQNSQRTGAITELTALQKTSDARKQAASDLDDIHTKMEKVASDSGNPALVEGVKKFGTEIDTLKSNVDLLGQHVEAVFEGAFGDAFASFITGAQSAGDAIKSFFKDLETEAARAIAKNIGQQIFGGLSSSGDNGGGGGFLSSLGKIAGAIYGGGKASGGPVKGGHAYRINERTPNSEYFVPAMDGSIVSGMGGGGSTENNFNFTVQAPGGQISKRTEQQIFAAAARGIGAANRRGN